MGKGFTARNWISSYTVPFITALDHCGNHVIAARYASLDSLSQGSRQIVCSNLLSTDSIPAWSLRKRNIPLSGPDALVVT